MNRGKLNVALTDIFQKATHSLTAILLCALLLISGYLIDQKNSHFKEMTKSYASLLHNSVAMGVAAKIFNNCENIFRNQKLSEVSVSNGQRNYCDLKRGSRILSVFRIRIKEPIRLSDLESTPQAFIEAEYSIALEVLLTLTLILTSGGLILLNKSAIRKVHDSIHKIIAEPLEKISQQLNGTEEIRYRSPDLTIELQSFIDRYNHVQKQNRQHEIDLQLISEEKAKFRLARQVAHDIRSPLSALEIVLRSFEDKSNDQYRVARMAVDRLKNIATDLLNQSRLSQSSRAKGQSVSLRECVEEIVTETLVQNKHLKHSITTSFATEQQVLAETTSMKRILSNLVNNAIESFDQPGLIQIGIEEKGDLILLTVTDNGKGIPAEVLPSVGEEGFSWGKGSSASSGNGLGLFNAKEKIKEWGGTLQIKSKPHLGTIVLMAFRKFDQNHQTSAHS